MKYRYSPEYQKLRKAEYPPIEEQLDALWSGGQKEADMRLLIQDIKARYPKPLTKDEER